MAKLQQVRAARTREAIMRAAAEVFDEYGFAGASISKIMSRAGVSQGAMYFHFKSKEDLAHAVMHAQPTAVVPHLHAEGLQRVVDMTFVWAWQVQRDVVLRAGIRLTNEQEGTTGLDEGPYAEWTQIIGLTLRAAQDEGEVRTAVNSVELAEFIVGACTGIQMFSNTVSRRADLPDRVVAMWRILLPGICTDRMGDAVDLDVHRFA